VHFREASAERSAKVARADTTSAVEGKVLFECTYKECGFSRATDPMKTCVPAVFAPSSAKRPTARG